MSKCFIQFDQNEHGIYLTGEVVRGNVHIIINKPKKLNGIKLEVTGYACAQWKDKFGRKRSLHKNVKRRRKYVYSGHEDYMASTTYLVGSKEAHNFIMDAGTHTYAFACPIPLNCPASFEGAMGHVRYLVKVTILHSGTPKQTHNIGFTVLKLVNLNHKSPTLKMPALNETVENFCLLHSKPVALQVHIPQSGYVPGQLMSMNILVRNASGIDCRKLVIFLNLRATYTADTPRLHTASEKICLVKQYCGPVPRGMFKEFSESLRIPATPPTCEHLSRVVRVSYEVCVVAIMGRLMCNPQVVTPIIIGNVPLVLDVTAGAAEALPTTSIYAIQEAERTDELGGDTDSFEELELPPPTYEEAMFMTTDIADNDVNTLSEATRFTPRFPVYDLDAMLAANVPDTDPKKRKRIRKNKLEMGQEKTPVESPIEI